MVRLYVVLPLLLFACIAKGDTGVLGKWVAGSQVTLSEANEYGINNCFKAETISDATFKRMWKRSYKKNCQVPRSDLRYVKVLHYTLGGKIQLGELVCNKAIANDLVDIFQSLFNAKYPIERMVLIDNYNANDEASMNANNTSAFNYRQIAGAKKLSRHSVGMAIDINPLYNPCVKVRNGITSIQPNNGKIYANRHKNFNYKISHEDLCYKLFKKHRFKWGGDWRTTKDYQHFEK